MANTFYAPGDQRAARVRDLFGAIASRYDLINDLQSFGLHRLWKRKLIRLASVRPGARALDLCCGTGDVTFALARRGASAVGLDFSAPMLAIAAERREKAAVRTALLRGDGMLLPFADGSFEVVTIAYGLRNLSSVEGGLREICRVTRPGGRMLALEFGKPANRSWRAVYFAYLKLVVPWFGRVFCGNAATYSYIMESLDRYPGQERVEGMMRELGCANVRVINLVGGVMSINYGEKPP